MLTTDLLSNENTVPDGAQPPGMHIQNPYCVRYAVDGTLLARQGAMVAYRGELEIRPKRQGAKSFVKRTVTGEGLALMEIEGRGDIWLADQAKNVFTVEIAAERGLSVSGANVLCFDPSLSYDVRRVKGAGMVGGGLFNCEFEGDGTLAVTTYGVPMVIPVTPGAPVYVDTDAVVGWSSALTTSVHRSQGIKALLRGGSGETFQLKLQGEGQAIVQPSEGAPGEGSGGGGGGIADAVGDVFG